LGAFRATPGAPHLECSVTYLLYMLIAVTTYKPTWKLKQLRRALDGSRLWSKGCTKVPALVREPLGIDGGSEIEWTLNDNDEVFAGKV